jgi:Phage tail tube protein
MSVQTSTKRFRIAPAPADLMTDAVAGFIYPQVESVEADCGRKHYPRDFLAADHDHFQGMVGEKDVALKFVTEMRGFGGAPAGAGSAVAATDGENGLLLKSVFGIQTKDTGNTVAAGSTGSIVNATSATLLSVGNFVGFVDPGTGLYHARQIRSKAANALTLDRALPFTPAAAAVLYASASYSHALQGHQHLWADVEGYDPTAGQNWRRYLRGLLGDLTFKFGPRSTLEWSFKGVDWNKADGTSQGAPSYPANLPVSGISAHRRARFWIGATQQKVTEFSFDLGNDLAEKLASEAANGIQAFFVRGAKRTGKFTVLHDDGGAAIFTSWEAQTVVDLLLELSFSGPGNSFALSAPFVELLSAKPKTVNGLDAYEFEFQVLRNDTITGVADVTLGVL